MIPPSIHTIIRTVTVASVSFVLGIMFLSDNLLLPQGNYWILAISLGTGILLPLFAEITSSVARWMLVVASGASALALVLLINGLVLPVAVAMLFVTLPCIVVLGFSQALTRGGDPASWRRDMVTLILALCFVVLSRAIKIAPFATWNALYVVVGLLLANAAVNAIQPVPILEERVSAAPLDEPASHPLGVKGWMYFIAGIAMACMAGVSAFVPGFLGDLSWFDPNPMAPGLPRAIIDRPWAPGDTLTILVLAVLVVALMAWFLLRHPARSLLVSTCLFAGFCAAWLLAWSGTDVPFFTWSAIGIPCYFGSITSVLVFLARWFKPPRQDVPRRDGWSFVGGMTRRAWLISIPFLGSAAAGLMFRDIFNWSMVLVPIMVAIPVVAGTAILAVLWIINATRGRGSTLPPKPFHVTATTSKRRVNSAIIMFLIFGGLYAASYTSYHAPYSGKLEGLYLWAGGIGTWAPAVETRATHAAIFALSLNATTGAVSSAWAPGNNDPYHARGIKVMPTIFLGYIDLYYMLKNIGGRLDTFVSTLAATLVATGVDGVSIDFEMLVDPPGLPKVTTEDWIVAWERISAEACHAGGNDFLLGVYWQIGGKYTRDQVNRYFRAVDIHVENMYETHKQSGFQGSTTVIEVSISSIIEIYSMLDDKAMMAKVMPGLPVYHYMWIDGRRVALNESEAMAGGRTDAYAPFMMYDFIEQAVITSNATFRWDPFSGASWSRFTMTLTNNQTVTVVAYLHDTGHLARTMHVMAGFGITGMMLWPAHQPVPPGFIETFYS